MREGESTPGERRARAVGTWSREGWKLVRKAVRSARNGCEEEGGARGGGAVERGWKRDGCERGRGSCADDEAGAQLDGDEARSCVSAGLCEAGDDSMRLCELEATRGGFAKVASGRGGTFSGPRAALDGDDLRLRSTPWTFHPADLRARTLTFG